MWWAFDDYRVEQRHEKARAVYLHHNLLFSPYT
jgi:hypothetical protein